MMMRLYYVILLSLALVLSAFTSVSADPAIADVPSGVSEIQFDVRLDDDEDHDEGDHEEEENHDADKEHQDGEHEEDDDGEHEEEHEEDDAAEKGASKDGDDEKDEAEEDEKKEVTITGRFVSSQMTPVSRRLEEWSDMTIKKIVPHGKQIKSGDVLIELDMVDIDDAISDLEHSIATDKLALEQSTEKLAMLKRTTKIDLESAELDNQKAQEELELFRKRDKKFGIEQNEFSLKNSKNRLAYQEEELKQLLKMYEADDLTEESEEIILKRTRDQVEAARFYMKRNKMVYDDYEKYSLPREQKSIETAAEQAAIAMEKAKITLPASIKELELSIQQKEVAHKRSLEKLATLKRDRKTMTIKAPRTGIVFYGECNNGAFPSPRTLSKELRANGSLKSDNVFMTIVSLRPLHILADVEEGDLRHINKDDSISFSPKAFPDMEMKAKVKEISRFPVEDGKFEVKLNCRLGADSDRIVPGMSCKLKVTPKPEKKEDKKKKKD